MPSVSGVIRHLRLTAAVLAFVSLLSSPPAAAAEKTTFLEIEVTEYSPVISDRYDWAFQQALESAFRKTLLLASREIAPTLNSPRDFALWQKTVFSRSKDFIYSYSIVSQSKDEGYLSLTVHSRVYRSKLEKALLLSSTLRPLLPFRLLILAETFPLSGSSGREDIDGGRLAAASITLEFTRLGAIIIAAPDRLPWQHLAGRATAENKVTLSAAEGKRLNADYVVLCSLTGIADSLLSLKASLLAVSSEHQTAVTSSPVELQADRHPSELFALPAREIVKSLSHRLTRVSSSLRQR